MIAEACYVSILTVEILTYGCAILTLIWYREITCGYFPNSIDKENLIIMN